jgi:acetolactate synthase-1/2/3 large subunit
MTGAQYLLNRLAEWGIQPIFLVPGAHIDHICYALASDSRFTPVLAAHELGAAYMADGFSRISGIPSVVLSNGGPGASNMITAAIVCRLDHSPVLFITGDAPSFLEEFDAFQNSGKKGSRVTDIFKACAYNSFQINNPSELDRIFNHFIKCYKANNPMPFHISLPFYVSVNQIENYFHQESEQKIEDPPETEFIQNSGKIPDRIPSKTVIYVGSELSMESDTDLILKMANDYQIPVAVTLEQKGLLHLLPGYLQLGVFGYAGVPKAFTAILDDELELIIIFGVKMNERNTACWNNRLFNSKRTFISAPPFNCEFQNKLTTMSFHSVRDAYKTLVGKWLPEEEKRSDGFSERQEWCSKLNKINHIDPDYKINETISPMHMKDVALTMQSSLPSDAPLFLDSGEHRYFTSIFWQPAGIRNLFTASQTAPMGWAIAAGIGASFYQKWKRIFVLTGDGCMFMHGNEIAFAAKYNCNVTFLVSNNSSYGRIKSRGKRYGLDFEQKITELPNVHWSGVAEKMGLRSYRATCISELKEAINSTIHAAGPYLIEMITHGGEDCEFAPSSFSSSSGRFLEDWKAKLEAFYS